MTRIYENRGYLRRQIISLVIVVLVMIYGAWEIYAAFFGTDDYHSPFGEMLGLGDDRLAFGVLFLGGGLYGGWQMLNDAHNTVASFDLDEATGATVTTLWRPFGPLKLSADLAAIRNWRLYVKLGKRNTRTFFIYADHPGHPQPLEFDLTRSDVTGLRKIAAEAVAEFDEATAPRNP